MEGFDIMAMSSYLTSPLPLNAIQDSEYLNALQGIDLQGQPPGFDPDTFARCVAPDRTCGF